MIYGWIWIAIIILSVVLAIISKRNFGVALACGAVVALVFDIGKIDLLVQTVIFVAVSAIVIVVIGKRVNYREGAGLEGVIGSTCTVCERVDAAAGCGQVMINGQSWSARSVDENEIYEVGESLKIVAIEGVKLICKK